MYEWLYMKPVLGATAYTRITQPGKEIISGVVLEIQKIMSSTEEGDRDWDCIFPV